MAPHSSTLAWKIPWMEEPGGLQSMGLLRSDTTKRLHFHFSLSCTGEGTGNPLQCSCLENPRDRGAWWAAIYGVAQSQTRLKGLSSSSKGNRTSSGPTIWASALSIGIRPCPWQGSDGQWAERKSCLTAHTDSCSSNTSHVPYQGDSGQHKLRRMWLLSTLNLALTPKILGTQSTKGHFHIKMPLQDHNR